MGLEVTCEIKIPAHLGVLWVVTFHYLKPWKDWASF